MPSRNETQPIVINDGGKPSPPDSSWWIYLQDVDHVVEWFARARAELPRMIGSPEAKKLRPGCLDDMLLRR